MSATNRPRLLILSFSPIASDARVLKQVELFAGRYDVTTCGYGPAPAGVVEHLQLPDDATIALDGRLITLRAYPLVYSRTPAVIAARAALAGRRFDVVLANDVETVPLALSLRAPVHADLHEYSPRLHDDNPAWARRIGPYVRWLCRRYVSRAASATTVGEGLARAYESEVGVRAQVVTNAAPYAERTPTEVVCPLRLVHSGAALRNRDLMVLLDAVALTTTPVTLDLFLMPNDPAYIAELRARGVQIDGVRVLDPVPYAQLGDTLAGYDVGIHVLPPVNFNNANALPNKLFDYVQARLALVVGPTPEMAAAVERHGIGSVARGFDARSLADVLDGLTPEKVAEQRAASHAVARELSAEQQVLVWERAIDALVGAPADGSAR